MDRYIGLDAPRVKLHARGARAERETTGVARRGDEREGTHRGAPQHSGISASVPGGRHAGVLVFVCRCDP